MKNFKFKAFAALAALVIMLTSCLGDGGNEVNLYGVAGVIEYSATTFKKVIRISDGSLIYSQAVDNDASIMTGDCCLVDLYIDYSKQNVTQTGYYTATVSNYVTVRKGYTDMNMTGGLKLQDNEQMIYDIPSMNFISNYLFIYSQHKELTNQENQYQLSFNPNEEVSSDTGTRTYNLYLTCQKTKDGIAPEVTPYHVNAFNVETLMRQIATQEKNLGNTKFSFKINYIKTINSDKTFTKVATDVITWNVSTILGTSN